MHDHGQVLKNDSLDLRASEHNQYVLQGPPTQENYIMEYDEAGSDQQAASEDSPAQPERARESTHSEYNDFVRLNHLSYPEHAYVDAMGSERQEDLYDCQFGGHQLPSQPELLNPQVLHMIQAAN